jgi:hypothetical protein
VESARHFYYQNPLELHIAQWSQGFPPGSTLHIFSFSKKSTSSLTVASSTPNFS